MSSEHFCRLRNLPRLNTNFVDTEEELTCSDSPPSSLLCEVEVDAEEDRTCSDCPPGSLLREVEVQNGGDLTCSDSPPSSLYREVEVDESGFNGGLVISPENFLWETPDSFEIKYPTRPPLVGVGLNLLLQPYSPEDSSPEDGWWVQFEQDGQDGQDEQGERSPIQSGSPLPGPPNSANSGSTEPFPDISPSVLNLPGLYELPPPRDTHTGLQEVYAVMTGQPVDYSLPDPEQAIQDHIKYIRAKYLPAAVRKPLNITGIIAAQSVKCTRCERATFVCTCI